MSIVSHNHELTQLQKKYENYPWKETSPHAFTMPRTRGQTSIGLPDAVNILMCSFLDSESIKQARAINQNMKRLIDNIIPRYSEMWTTSKNAFHKEFIKRYPLAIKNARDGHSWELAFMKFQDRPVWQRVGLIGLTLVLSPAIFVYNLPKIGKGGLKRVIKPLIQWTCNKLIKSAEFVARCVKNFFVALYNGIIKPFYNITVTILKFTYEKILQPTGKALIDTIKAVDHLIRKICTFINDKAIVPTTNLAKRIAHWTNENIVQPTVNAIKEVARALFITLPKKTWEHVIKPSGIAIGKVVKAIFQEIVIPVARSIGKAIKWCYDKILTPLMNLAKEVFKAVFITFPSKVFEHIVIPVAEKVWAGVKFTYNWILSPIGRAIKTIAKGIFVTIPTKVWNHILYPVLEATWKGIKFTYNYILTPVARFVIKIAKGVLITIPSKVFEHVLKPTGEFTWKVITLAYDCVVYPILRAIGETVKFLFTVVIPAFFNHTVVPIAQTVSFTASLLFNQVFVPLAKAVAELARAIFIEGPILINSVVIKPALTITYETYNVISGLVIGITKKIFGG